MCFRLYWSLIEYSTGESAKSSSTWMWNAFLACNYLLLRKTPPGRESNTVPQGYGMYFKPKLSLVESSAEERVKYFSTKMWNVFFTIIISYWKLRRGESQIQIQKGMECISVFCIYLLLKSSAGEILGYSSTKVWDVFKCAVIFSYWRLCWGECKIQFYRDLECILSCHYILMKASLGKM